MRPPATVVEHREGTTMGIEPRTSGSRTTPERAVAPAPLVAAG